MVICNGCGCDLTNSRSKKFCSNKCQQEHQQHQKVLQWLETGEANPGSHRNHYVRTFIYTAQLGACALCGIDSQWQGKELVFVLDHIDGNSENNRRENLRLVCPNCDSQLETYKAKNKGNGRHTRRQRYAEGKSY